MGVAASNLGGEDVSVAVPCDPLRRSGPSGSEIARLAARRGDKPDVAAGDALIAHQAADEGDGFAVGRPAGNGDLQAVERAGDGDGVEDLTWGVAHNIAGNNLPLKLDAFDYAGRIELGDPPVVFAGWIGGDVGQRFGIGRPVEFVDVEVGGREEIASGRLAGVGRNSGDALHLDVIFADDAGGRVHSGERARRPRGPFDVKECNALAVGREGRRSDIAVECSETLRDIAVEMGEVKVELFAGLCAIRGKDKRCRIRGPGEARFCTLLIGRRRRR